MGGRGASAAARSSNGECRRHLTCCWSCELATIEAKVFERRVTEAGRYRYIGSSSPGRQRAVEWKIKGGHRICGFGLAWIQGRDRYPDSPLAAQTSARARCGIPRCRLSWDWRPPLTIKTGTRHMQAPIDKRVPASGQHGGRFLARSHQARMMGVGE
jgi:hypothetical protein